MADDPLTQAFREGLVEIRKKVILTLAIAAGIGFLFFKKPSDGRKRKD